MKTISFHFISASFGNFFSWGFLVLFFFAIRVFLTLCADDITQIVQLISICCRAEWKIPRQSDFCVSRNILFHVMFSQCLLIVSELSRAKRNKTKQSQIKIKTTTLIKIKNVWQNEHFSCFWIMTRDSLYEHYIMRWKPQHSTNFSNSFGFSVFVCKHFCFDMEIDLNRFLNGMEWMRFHKTSKTVNGVISSRKCARKNEMNKNIGKKSTPFSVQYNRIKHQIRKHHQKNIQAKLYYVISIQVVYFPVSIILSLHLSLAHFFCLLLYILQNDGRKTPNSILKCDEFLMLHFNVYSLALGNVLRSSPVFYFH